MLKYFYRAPLAKSRARALSLGLILIAALPAAHAQVIDLNATGGNNLSCLGQRFGSAISNCNAGDFTSSATVINNGSATTCVHGQTFSADLQFTITGGSSTSYNVGIFVGQNGNNPATTTSGNICAVAAMPDNVSPWSHIDNNTCGDSAGAFTNNSVTMKNIQIVSCMGTPGGKPQVPYTIAWSKNANTPATCAGPADIVNSPVSKCNGGNATVTNMTITPAADLSMQKSVQISGNQITYTLTIANAGPDAANGATWDDPVPAAVAITGTPVCAPATGAPTCGAVNVSGNDASGSISAFPANSSVTITITGTAPNNTNVGNTASVTAPSGVTDPNTNNNSSTVSGGTLPVRLQEFDVSAVTGSPHRTPRAPH